MIFKFLLFLSFYCFFSLKAEDVSDKDIFCEKKVFEEEKEYKKSEPMESLKKEFFLKEEKGSNEDFLEEEGVRKKREKEKKILKKTDIKCKTEEFFSFVTLNFYPSYIFLRDKSFRETYKNGFIAMGEVDFSVFSEISFFVNGGYFKNIKEN